MHLDVVGFEASLVQSVWIAWHIGKPWDIASQVNIRARRLKLKSDMTHRLHPVPDGSRGISETRQAHAILHLSFQIDVGADNLLAVIKAVGFGQMFAIFANV